MNIHEKQMNAITDSILGKDKKASDLRSQIEFSREGEGSISLHDLAEILYKSLHDEEVEVLIKNLIEIKTLYDEENHEEALDEERGDN